MNWKAAPSVQAVLTQADARWPKRARAADGIIGDAAHQAQGSGSDHNPDANGIVHAVDVTNGLYGPDCSAFTEHLRVTKDHRIKYVIFNRRIFLGAWSDSVRAGTGTPWVWYPYSGSDPHTGHVHISIGYDSTAENDTGPWFAPVKKTLSAHMLAVLHRLHILRSKG